MERQIIGLSLLTFFPVGCTSPPEREFARYMNEGREFVTKKDYASAIICFKNASRVLPADAEPYYQLGVAEIAVGSNHTASNSLNRAISRNPKHLEALLRLSELYSHSTKEPAVQESTRLAQRALAIAPDNVKGLNILALAEIRSGNPRGAQIRLEKVVERFPNDVEAAINLARARMMLKDRQGAEEILRQASSRSAKDAKALFALADFCQLTGDVYKAQDAYARGLLLEPDHAPARAALARLQLAAGKGQAADASFALLAKNPDRRFRFAYATHLFEARRMDAAIEELSRIVRENGKDREATTNLMKAYFTGGRVVEGEKLAAEVLKGSPKDPDALLQRARLSLARGAPEAAEKDLEQVLADRPDLADAHYLKAAVYGQRRRFDLQKRELYETLRLDPGQTVARVELSRFLLGRSGPTAALTLLDAAPEGRRQDLALRIQRVWPLIELSRLDEARAAIDALLRVAPGVEVLLQDSALRLRQKDFVAALAAAQKALVANPADVRALELVMRSSKRPGEGLEIVRRHAAQNVKTPVVQLFLGQVELMAGNRKQARDAFELAKAGDPRVLDAEWKLIDLCIAERNFDEARKRISPLLTGEAEPLARARLGLVEQNIGNFLAASEHYSRVLQSNPEEITILNSLAYILTEFAGKPNEALQYARTAKKLAPNDAAVDDTLGWTYYGLKLYPNAIQHLELAVKREPTARRHAHLSMAYARNGDKVRARQTLDIAKKLDPAIPEAALALKVLLAAGSAGARTSP